MSQDILSIYQDMGLTPKMKTATEYAGPCPGCGGRDRFCMFVGQGKEGSGRYMCRGCGLHGDAIQFLREFRGLGYRDACRALGMTPAPVPEHGHRTHVPSAQAAPTWSPKFSESPNPKWREKAGKLVRWAARQLQDDARALAWLAEERGLTPETAARFHVGWNPKDLFRDREAWGLAQELKPDGKRRMLWIPHGLVLPVLDASGQVARIKFRLAKPRKDQPKYIFLASEPKNTAPLVAVGQARPWVVVESELDGMLLAQEAGELVNVLALGSASLRPDAEAHAALTAAPFILVALDFDDAGNKSAWQWWPEHFPAEKVRVWPVPEGKDPTDSWKAGWDLSAWIEGGLPPALLPRRAPQIHHAVNTPPDDPDPARQVDTQGGHAPADAPAYGAADGPAIGSGDALDRERDPAAGTAMAAGPGHGAADGVGGHTRLSMPRKSKPTPEMVRAYKLGRAWIHGHTAELLARGWTRAGLFRAGRYRFPCGSWGLAWCGCWGNSDLGGVAIAPDGTVVFELHEPGRVVRQTVRPR